MRDLSQCKEAAPAPGTSGTISPQQQITRQTGERGIFFVTTRRAQAGKRQQVLRTAFPLHFAQPRSKGRRILNRHGRRCRRTASCRTLNPGRSAQQMREHAPSSMETHTPDSQAQAMHEKAPHDRRSGKDRRQREDGPPGKHERRHTIEPRQPEVRELHLSSEELAAMGFGQAAAQAPTSRQPA
jgi:hypothetical protein